MLYLVPIVQQHCTVRCVLSANVTKLGELAPEEEDGSELMTTESPVLLVDSVMTGGELDWDEVTQGFVLGAFFYGYCVTQASLLQLSVFPQSLGGDWQSCMGHGSSLGLASWQAACLPYSRPWPPAHTTASSLLSESFKDSFRAQRSLACSLLWYAGCPQRNGLGSSPMFVSVSI
ncbi:hypothetical protein Hamer_G006464 [Homarus americanus]|uniref:Uncharacterized protein n=1 Tax=Homarus americanus TaxID=6706 RepID=A0A8J5MM51_HOMAM|nr:hypothetical protein Hamer_G006464 [Homarus americanus]